MFAGARAPSHMDAPEYTQLHHIVRKNRITKEIDNKRDLKEDQEEGNANFQVIVTKGS